MKEILINNQNYKIPEGWEDLTFERYCQVFYGLKDNPDKLSSVDTNNEITIFSRLIGIDEDVILNAPIDFYNRLRDLFSFIYEKESFYFKDADNELIIDGVKYHIPSNDELTLRQHIDIDITTQEPDSPTKFIELLAIALVGENEKYTGDEKEREDLMNKLKNLPCTKAFQILGFFLLKGKILNNLISIFTHMEEEINHFPLLTQNS